MISTVRTSHVIPQVSSFRVYLPGGGVGEASFVRASIFPLLAAALVAAEGCAPEGPASGGLGIIFNAFHNASSANTMHTYVFT
jgi:hypothetical protein